MPPPPGGTAGSSNAPLTTGCGDTQMVPAAGNLSQVAATTLCLINQQRTHAGLTPLHDDTRLDQAARAHSQDMTARGYFDHVSPSGSTPESRVTAVGYLKGAGSWAVGENIAWGSLTLATPQEIVSSWMRSPGHRANILDARFRDSGIGVSPAVPRLGLGQAGATYTQDFGFVG